MNISFFTNSSYFSGNDLATAWPDFQDQISGEFNWFWGISAALDIGGSGFPLLITDAGGSTGGVLGYHTYDTNYNPYAIVYADQCVQFGVPVTGVISHEMLEMAADQLTDTVDLYDNGNGTGFIVDQEVCDPCEMSLYYEGVRGTIVSDFVTPAWFVPGDPNPVDYLGAIGGPWQLASGGYVCYQDVTLSGLICVGDKVQKAIAKAGKTINLSDNPGAQVLQELRLKGKHAQTVPKNGPFKVTKRNNVPAVSRQIQ